MNGLGGGGLVEEMAERIRNGLGGGGVCGIEDTP